MTVLYLKNCKREYLIYFLVNRTFFSSETFNNYGYNFYAHAHGNDLGYECRKCRDDVSTELVSLEQGEFIAFARRCLTNRNVCRLTSVRSLATISSSPIISHSIFKKCILDNSLKKKKYLKTV